MKITTVNPKSKLALIITLIVFTSTNAQWRYKSGKSDFDGNYKTAYVSGNGGDFPYNKPKFVINLFEGGRPNIYLTGMGYTGCNNNDLLFKFNDEDQIYFTLSVSTNSENDTLFIDKIEGLSIIDFIEKLKLKSKMSLRFKSDCTKRDYVFTLSGSTKSINYVLMNYIDDTEDRLKLLTDAREKIENSKRVLDSLNRELVKTYIPTFKDTTKTNNMENVGTIVLRKFELLDAYKFDKYRGDKTLIFFEVGKKLILKNYWKYNAFMVEFEGKTYLIQTQEGKKLKLDPLIEALYDN